MKQKWISSAVVLLLIALVVPAVGAAPDRCAGGATGGNFAFQCL